MSKRGSLRLNKTSHVKLKNNNKMVEANVINDNNSKSKMSKFKLKTQTKTHKC